MITHVETFGPKDFFGRQDQIKLTFDGYVQYISLDDAIILRMKLNEAIEKAKKGSK